MRAVIIIGQVIFSLIWILLLANLVAPFPGQAFGLFVLLLGILVVLHLLQMLIFYAAFHAHVHPTGKDYGAIFLFGVIGWMMVLQKRNAGAPRA